MHARQDGEALRDRGVSDTGSLQPFPERVNLAGCQITDEHAAELRSDVANPCESIAVPRVQLQLRDVAGPPKLNNLGQRLRAALRVEQRAKFLRSLLLSNLSASPLNVNERE